MERVDSAIDEVQYLLSSEGRSSEAMRVGIAFEPIEASMQSHPGTLTPARAAKFAIRLEVINRRSVPAKWEWLCRELARDPENESRDHCQRKIE